MRENNQNTKPADGEQSQDRRESLTGKTNDPSVTEQRLAALDHLLNPLAPAQAGDQGRFDVISDQTARLVRKEIDIVNATIRESRLALATLQRDKEGCTRISKAPGALVKVIGEMEAATETILTNCEQIDKMIESLGEDTATKVRQHIIAILEACNFQDITGQRITRVIKTLEDVDWRIQRIASLWGGAMSMRNREPQSRPDLSEDKTITGPCDESAGPCCTQDEIEKLQG